MAKDLKYGHVTLEHGTIGDDEPVVVFRAQDKLLPELLRVYGEMCADEGSPEKHLAGIRNARQCVEDWQVDNPTQVPRSDGTAHQG